MNGHKLVPSDYIKYLGIYVDSTLSGTYHCNILTTKLKRANGMLSKIRHYVPPDELRSIYHAIFSSHMIYGCQIWGQGDQGNIQKIIKLQNKAIRTINFKGPGTETDKLYSDSKVLKVEDFIKLCHCLFIHDYLNDMLPKCFEDYYLQLNSMYFERTKNAKLGCLFVPFRKSTKYGLNSITLQSILTWNSICKTLKTDLSKKSRYELKSIITTYFLSRYAGNDYNQHNQNQNSNQNNNQQHNINNHNNNNNNHNNHNNNIIINNRRQNNRRNQRARNNNYYGQLRPDVPRPRF